MLARVRRKGGWSFGRTSYLGNNEAGCLLSIEGGIDEVELSDEVEDTEDVDWLRDMLRQAMAEVDD